MIKQITTEKPAIKASKPIIKAVNKKPKNNKITIKLVKSFYGRLPAHRATIIGLGLKRINHVVRLEDTPQIRGMINKVSYMLEVEG